MTDLKKRFAQIDLKTEWNFSFDEVNECVRRMCGEAFNELVGSAEPTIELPGLWRHDDSYYTGPSGKKIDPMTIFVLLYVGESFCSQVIWEASLTDLIRSQFDPPGEDRDPDDLPIKSRATAFTRQLRQLADEIDAKYKERAP